MKRICALLHALLVQSRGSNDNNMSLLNPVMAEIQAFCLTFSRIREAVMLYGLIKATDG